MGVYLASQSNQLTALQASLQEREVRLLEAPYRPRFEIVVEEFTREKPLPWDYDLRINISNMGAFIEKVQITSVDIMTLVEYNYNLNSLEKLAYIPFSYYATPITGPSSGELVAVMEPILGTSLGAFQYNFRTYCGLAHDITALPVLHTYIRVSYTIVTGDELTDYYYVNQFGRSDHITCLSEKLDFEKYIQQMKQLSLEEELVRTGISLPKLLGLWTKLLGEKRMIPPVASIPISQLLTLGGGNIDTEYQEGPSLLTP